MGGFEQPRAPSLDDYQLGALRTINPSLTDPDRLLDAAAGLAEEGGEVLALIRKHRFQGKSLDRSSLAAELGDALWCLAIVAHSAGFRLSEIAARNESKLRNRHPSGFNAPGE